MPAALRLTAHDLACDRGGRRVFDGVSFALGPGEALVLTGPNGAGKSTLLRLIAGLLPPAAGTLTADGGPPDTPVSELAHYVGHQDAVKPQLTTAENLAFWARVLGNGEALVIDALATFGLDHLADLPAAYLSAGQRRRLALVRLLAVRRPLWLLDEPTTAIDAASEARLTSVMAEHLSAGGLLIAATHAPLDLPRARRLDLGVAA